MIWSFIGGLFVGFYLGMLVVSLCVVAKGKEE
jgi:hypothetical protein